jgi:hypothetical protein
VLHKQRSDKTLSFAVFIFSYISDMNSDGMTPYSHRGRPGEFDSSKRSITTFGDTPLTRTLWHSEQII